MALMRPLCWILGHRWAFASSLSGPINRCRRCRTVQRR
jgi:hypothetical protein